MTRRLAVTLTTIHLPKLLGGFAELQQTHGNGGMQVDYIVVGDRKTPVDAAALIAELDGRGGSRFLYLDMEEQRRRFSHLTALWQAIPPDSFARRNYADLLAYQEGYDLVVRIDDDNFPVPGDFFGAHAVAGRRVKLPTLRSSTGWCNVCEPLRERNGIAFYPRGFPIEERWKAAVIERTHAARTVAVNAGLWLGDPDVDALTRLCRPVDAVGFDSAVWGSAFALAPGTWAPINTQNTAFSRATLPAAFISPHSQRYDDIISGYVLRRICDHLDQAVVYGLPLLQQDRNPHDLWKDLDLERAGGETIGAFTAILRDIPLRGGSFADCYGELVAGLRGRMQQRSDFYSPILDSMEIWAELFARGAAA